MRFLILSVATRGYEGTLLNEFPADKKQHVKSFHGDKIKIPIEITL
ncbi:hypothetical protein [Candidatus Methylopumilus planktonicus]